MLLCAPLGLTIGFAMTAAISIYSSWEISFWIMAILSIIFSITFLLLDEKYFDLNKTYEHKQQCIAKVYEDEHDE